jgi:hypothetical protein
MKGTTRQTNQHITLFVFLFFHLLFVCVCAGFFASVSFSIPLSLAAFRSSRRALFPLCANEQFLLCCCFTFLDSPPSYVTRVDPFLLFLTSKKFSFLFEQARQRNRSEGKKPTQAGLATYNTNNNKRYHTIKRAMD